MSKVAKILVAINEDPQAAEEFIPLVYQERRKRAAEKLKREKPGQTIQATVLVHEAWLRLVRSNVNSQWNDRSHFFGAAAEAMRRTLVEQARRKQTLKRQATYPNGERHGYPGLHAAGKGIRRNRLDGRTRRCLRTRGDPV